MGTKWADDPKRQRLSGRQRDMLLREEEAQREYRKRLEAIKAKLDLYGEHSLTPEERMWVRKHPGFFYPEEE